MDRQPLENLTLYAELLEQLRAAASLRSLGALEGSFVNKNVKGELYVYFQYYDSAGVKRQMYVGKKTPALDKIVEAHRSERNLFAQDTASIQRLSAQLRAGGALSTDHPSARVLRQMAESGVFRLGGVLVGTHAYIVLGNLLGIRWEHATTRTRDIDIAASPKREADLAIALPHIEADIPSALERLQMGFFPIPELDPRQPSTSFMIRGNLLRVDILTPMVNRETTPTFIPRFKTAAQPLRFLDYLIDEKIPAAVIDGGGILVNVPRPGRYAIHKLIVAQERGPEVQAKKEKDLFQAYQLLSVLKEDRPGDISIAMENAMARGTGWQRRVETSLEEIRRKYGLSGVR